MKQMKSSARTIYNGTNYRFAEQYQKRSLKRLINARTMCNNTSKRSIVTQSRGGKSVPIARTATVRCTLNSSRLDSRTIGRDSILSRPFDGLYTSQQAYPLEIYIIGIDNQFRSFSTSSISSSLGSSTVENEQNHENERTSGSGSREKTGSKGKSQKKRSPGRRKMVDPIKITDKAAERIKLLLSRKPDAVGVLLGVRTRGCNGLSYTLDYKYAENVKKFEDKVEDKGVTVYIDPKAMMHIIGTTMDFVEDELSSGFEFTNPNEASRCGCGESFNVDPKQAQQQQQQQQQQA